MSTTVIGGNWRFNCDLKQVKISTSYKKKYSLGFWNKDGRCDYQRTNISFCGPQSIAITAVIGNLLPLGPGHKWILFFLVGTLALYGSFSFHEPFSTPRRNQLSSPCVSIYLLFLSHSHQHLGSTA